MKRLLQTVLMVMLFLPARAAYAQPHAISDLTALASNEEGKITLQWTAPDPGDIGTPDGYLVVFSTAEINAAGFNDPCVHVATCTWPALAANGLEQSVTLSWLTPGGTFYFAAKARDGSDTYGFWFSSGETSGAVNTMSYGVIYDSFPAQASLTSAVGNTGFVDLSWQPNLEIDIQWYTIECSTYSDASGFSTIATILYPGTTHQHTGLDNGNTYYYRIRAADWTNHSGAYSDVGSAVPSVSLGAFDLVAAQSISISSTTLQWAWAPAENAQSYRVISSTSGEIIKDTDETSWLQTNLTPDTSSEVSIQAYNGWITRDSAPLTQYTG